MTHFKNFTIADPRHFDGTPYEVAERAAAQLEGLALLAKAALPTAELMARNAEMSRRMDLGGDPEGDRWVTEPQGRQWRALTDEIDALLRRLKAIKAASGYDPRHPPK